MARIIGKIRLQGKRLKGFRDVVIRPGGMGVETAA
jgi:hypothetical protein